MPPSCFYGGMKKNEKKDMFDAFFVFIAFLLHTNTWRMALMLSKLDAFESGELIININQIQPYSHSKTFYQSLLIDYPQTTRLPTSHVLDCGLISFSVLIKKPSLFCLLRLRLLAAAAAVLLRHPFLL